MKHISTFKNFLNEAKNDIESQLTGAAHDAYAAGDYVAITPKTKIKVGDNIVSFKGLFAEITKATGDSYKITWDMDDESSQRNRAALEKGFLIKK